jgi:predicted nucleotidyltransferase
MKSVRIKNLSVEETERIIPPNTILLGYTGSISHGTHIPTTNPDCIDDIDLMGVCVGNVSVYLGLGRFEQKEAKYKEWDSVVYEIRKFFSLLLKGNPNVLGLLWLNDEHYIHQTLAGTRLLASRDLFVSKQAYHAFIGYAYGQLKRMTHYKFEGYMGVKRKELVDRFGYDVKNAAHLIRLLRMGIEFLVEGRLHVFRADREELKEIKSGGWTLERVKAESDVLFKTAHEVYAKSEIPAHPNFKKAEQLLIEIIETSLARQKAWEGI